ncbi:MAG: acyl-CoA dehydrogenase family protein [Dehalococcoidia bacterium]|nr:acyl-CoA dehydrogenase family protein [Dehalococcoidia bacterium]
MDFEHTYTKEQEQFRKEVRTWLEANVPEKMKMPLDEDDFTEEMYLFWREKHKEMAARGWLFPTLPKQYGGGGLSPELAIVLTDELSRFRAQGPFTIDFITPAILVWATEEQKQKFLVPILKGEKIAWQKFTEPKSGSDLASYQSSAVKDGDDWIMNGSNVFVSGNPADRPDYLYGPMLTDRDAPRHRNLGYFLIPAQAPGVTIRKMNLVSGSGQNFVFMDNVRVPGDHLIGGDHQGWQVAMTSSEKEHGGEGSIFRSEGPIENLVSYVQERRRQGVSPGGNLVLQQKIAEAHIEERIADVLNKRTAWMYHAGQEINWEGANTQFYSRESGLRQVGRVRDVMGMYALLGTGDQLAPHGGRQEVNQRTSFILQHGAGSLNIAKVVIARRIGISRTRERAAATPMTAGRTAAATE